MWLILLFILQSKSSTYNNDALKVDTDPGTSKYGPSEANFINSNIATCDGKICTCIVRIISYEAWNGQSTAQC